VSQLTTAAKTLRVINATAAGQTTINGSAVDTAGYELVRFVVAFGALVAGSVTSIKVQTGAASNLSDAADVAGTGGSITAGGTDDNQLAIVEIYRPAQRYARVVVLRATQNATVDGAIAELYEGQAFPITKDATVTGQKVLASPALGTP